MRETYFHEDDYCQIELILEANWDFCVKQSSDIDAFSAEHRTEFGWTDMYARGENPHRLIKLQMSISELTTALSPVLPQFDRVITGYSSYTETCQHTVAFGRNHAVVFYAESSEDEIVSAIWLALDTTTREEKQDAILGLQALSAWPLILADWGWTTMIRSSDTAALDGYFDKRIQVFSRPVD